MTRRLDPTALVRFAAIGALLAIATSAGFGAAEGPSSDLGLSPEEIESYGERAEFFAKMPSWVRPDLDWREHLSPELRGEQPVWSQAYEELIIRDFFGDKREGVFVDVGCHLPRHMSTTYLLESEFGWSGIGIDVNDQFAPHWKRHRPQTAFVQTAVGETDGEVLDMHVSKHLFSFD